MGQHHVRVGLIAVLAGITYGILPYGGHDMGWTSPGVIAALAGGLAMLGLFVMIERRVAAPMFRLGLFRIRAFSGGSVATFLAALSRGGLMFMLILWLQGVWLPEHGYSFSDTPLWAGIYMLPLSAGFLIAGPIAGRLADHFGARPFATGGMIMSAIGFLLLIVLPIDFTYWQFGGVIFLIGLAMGLFAAPNLTGIMNSLPPDQRGSGAGMAATFQNAAPRRSRTCRTPPPRISPDTASSRRWSRIRSRPASTPCSTSRPAAAWWRRSPRGCEAGVLPRGRGRSGRGRTARSRLRHRAGVVG